MPPSGKVTVKLLCLCLELQSIAVTLYVKKLSKNLLFELHWFAFAFFSSLNPTLLTDRPVIVEDILGDSKKIEKMKSPPLESSPILTITIVIQNKHSLVVKDTAAGVGGTFGDRVNVALTYSTFGLTNRACLLTLPWVVPSPVGPGNCPCHAPPLRHCTRRNTEYQFYQECSFKTCFKTGRLVQCFTFFFAAGTLIGWGGKIIDKICGKYS